VGGGGVFLRWLSKATLPKKDWVERERGKNQNRLECCTEIF